MRGLIERGTVLLRYQNRFEYGIVRPRSRA